jgi:hypothetical protein
VGTVESPVLATPTFVAKAILLSKCLARVLALRPPNSDFIDTANRFRGDGAQLSADATRSHAEENLVGTNKTSNKPMAAAAASSAFSTVADVIVVPFI